MSQFGIDWFESTKFDIGGNNNIISLAYFIFMYSTVL